MRNKLVAQVRCAVCGSNLSLDHDECANRLPNLCSSGDSVGYYVFVKPCTTCMQKAATGNKVLKLIAEYVRDASVKKEGE